MKYCMHYDRLIARAKGRTILGYVEKHHVIPRCMGGSDEPSNLVRLTPEEHYVAHQLLVKMFPNDKRLVFAAIAMCFGPHENRSANKMYAWLKRNAPSMPFTEETRAKMGAARLGRKHSEETKLKISLKSKGHTRNLKGVARSEEVCEKMRAAQMGHSVSEETREKLRACNTGRKHTEAARERISLALKGKPFSAEHRYNLGEANRLRADVMRQQKMSQTHKET